MEHQSNRRKVPPARLKLYLDVTTLLLTPKRQAMEETAIPDVKSVAGTSRGHS